jgi:hypothetical protein
MEARRRRETQDGVGGVIVLRPAKARSGHAFASEQAGEIGSPRNLARIRE